MSNELVQTKVLDTIETKCYSPKLKHTDHQKEESTILPPVYSIKMKDATVIGGSNIILKDNKALYNHNIGNNVNYSDSAFHDYRKIYKLGRNKIYIPSAQKLNIEKGISFCINYSFNYYHFIFESLSKFQLLEMLDIDTSWPIIIDKTAMDIPQFQELLQIFNKSKRRVIYINSHQHIYVKDLLIFTPIHYLPANFVNISSISCKDVAFNKDNILFLRKKIMSSFGKCLSDYSYSKKLFISRHNFKTRSYNNDEIQTTLETLDFTTVYPEKLSLYEQVKMFHNAECIVAATGAALTNILFCRPKTKIYVLTSIYMDLSIFSTIAKYLNLDMAYIIADSKESDELHTSFYININRLTELISTD